MIRYLLILLLSSLSVRAVEIVPADWLLDYTSPLIRYSGNRLSNSWTVYTNLPSSTTVAGINSAIVNCPAGQMILLSNGTFTIDAQITVGRSNIRIQGMGPTQTILNITASSGRVISVGAGDLPFTTSTTWTGGYSKGAATVTVSSAASMSVGRLITLSQQTKNPGIVSNNGDEGPSIDASGAIQNITNVMQHTTIITSINGTTIGLGIPLGSTNWDSSQSPICHIQTQTTRTNIVLDGFQMMNNVTANDSYNFRFGNSYDILIQNVWSRYAGGGSADKGSRHVTTLHVGKIEVIDSAFQGSIAGGVESYGIAFYNCTGFYAENNIFDGVTGIFKPTCSGYGVFAYNFAINITWNPSANWLQACIGTHGTHNWGIAIEGNIAPSARFDNIHGSASHILVFRNRFPGYETTARVDNAMALALQASNKCFVVAGNVLGKTNWQTVARNIYPTVMDSTVKTVEEYGYTNVSYNTVDGDANTFNTAIITHNQISQTLNGGTNGGVYWASGYSHISLPLSYVHPEGKPDWWGCTNEFPGIGPEFLSICTNDTTVWNPAKGRYLAGNYFTNFNKNSCGMVIAGPGKQSGRKIRTQ
jgi:hypothetical protein